MASLRLLQRTETRMHFEQRETTFGAFNPCLIKQKYFFYDTVFSQGLHQIVFLLGRLREKIHSFKSRVTKARPTRWFTYLYFKVSSFNTMEQKVNI